jgi:hypothetical protein
MKEKDRIREFTRESALQIVGEKGYVMNYHISEAVGISPTSAAILLVNNYDEWNLEKKNAYEGISTAKRWFYVKKNGKVPTEEVRRELELRNPKPATKYQAGVTNRRKSLSEEMRLDDWIIDLHVRKGKLDFFDIKKEAKEYFGKRLDTSRAVKLREHYERLMANGRVVYDEKGFFDLPKKLFKSETL